MRVSLYLALLATCLLGGCKPSETKVVEMCRDDRAQNEKQAQALTEEGWVYQGPVFDNGINCTNSLWAR